MQTLGRVRTIHRLPPVVADAIAAGEVVERPAAVVKELCENAVDAGATRIDVRVEGAGTVRMGVADDGCGIAADQLELAVARHATSKIATAEDLERVPTLGFRGEALASIAAVSDLTLESRTREATTGARLRVRHGERVDAGVHGRPPGTSVEVADLFAGTPARLRFLRSDRVETAAAIQVVHDLVLARPELAITCVVDRRTAIRTAGGGLHDALRCVFGADAAELIPVDDEGDINVGGAISQPRRHHSTRGDLVLLINRRRIHNRSLTAAVAEAYRGLLPTGRHPFGVVSIELDPVEVDVNVHPTKREVRFRDERRVFAAVQRACWRALQSASVQHSSVWTLPDGVVSASLQLADRREPGDRPPDGGTWTAGQPSAESAPPIQSVAGLTGESDTVTEPGLAGLRPLSAVGQAGSRWLVASSPQGVVLVDPHAAHEKVLYVELLTGWSEGVASGQLLLMPVLVDTDSLGMQVFDSHREVLERCGFAAEPFGPLTLRCTAVPAHASGADPGRLLSEMLSTLAGAPVSEHRHRLAALVACHAAVRFGDELSRDAQQRLLDRLVVTPGGLTCPHGRPTVVVLEEAALRRSFRRPYSG